MSRASISKRLPITGYLDKISGRPTESLAVKVSAEDAGEYQADVVQPNKCVMPPTATLMVRV